MNYKRIYDMIVADEDSILMNLVAREHNIVNKLLSKTYSNILYMIFVKTFLKSDGV